MSLNTQEQTEEMEDAQCGKYLTFTLDEEEFGIEIRHVKEIIGMQPITQLPETPDYIKGIINLRGKIIPLIDMRVKFKKNSAEYTDRTCIIVTEINDLSVGLIIDSVSEVVSVADEAISPPPDYRTGIQNTYIKGIDKTDNRVKLLLNCEKLILEDEDDIRAAK
jgi:Chemotaxis signal transduction protein